MKLPLVIFTDKEHAPYFLRLRKKYQENTVVIIKEFHQLHEYAHYALYQEHHAKNKEKDIHDPELYIIWNEKLHFVKEAYELNVFRSQWFMWMDIGAFRGRKRRYDYDLKPREIRQWPDVEKVTTMSPHKVVMTKTEQRFDVQQYAKEKENIATLTLRTREHVGGLFLIHSSILLKIHNLYYTLKDNMSSHGTFIGVEQNIYARLAIGYPEYFHMIDPPHPFDVWFYFHQYFLPEKLLQKKMKPSLYQSFKNIVKGMLWKLGGGGYVLNGRDKYGIRYDSC